MYLFKDLSSQHTLLIIICAQISDTGFVTEQQGDSLIITATQSLFMFFCLSVEAHCNSFAAFTDSSLKSHMNLVTDETECCAYDKECSINC